MKKISFYLIGFLGLNLLSLHAQPGARAGGNGPRGTQFNAALAKLFGDNTAFSGTMENQIELAADRKMSVSGKVAFDSGKSHFEMDLAEAKGNQMSPQTLEQMKMMGLSKMTVISRPDRKVAYFIYPGMKAYAETPITDPDVSKPDSAFQLKTTELGNETVDGHACVKLKAVVTDDTGKTHESTVWKANDLKKFPIKIETTEQGHPVTMLFKEVKFGKPEATLFEPPADFKKYNSLPEIMQAAMMQHMNATPGAPPQQ